MKVKEEDLRRELLKVINGEDLIINCARRLGIRLNNFKCRLYTARIHGIESVLHSNRPGPCCGIPTAAKSWYSPQIFLIPFGPVSWPCSISV